MICPDSPDGGVRVIGDAELARFAAFPPRDYAETDAEDPAYLIYTSGTASKPKGVLHAQRVALGRAPMLDPWEGLTRNRHRAARGRDELDLYARRRPDGPVLRGALTAVLYNGPADARVWPRLIARFGATIFAAVPGVYRQMLRHEAFAREDLSGLRHGLTAGEALPPALAADFTEKTGKPLYEALGMSEISTYISTGPGVPYRAGSPGKPQPGRRVVILPIEGGETPLPAGESGLIAVHRSDPGLMLGYWRNPEAEAEVFRGEWFVGGDVAHLDADGYVWMHGRADDLMNAGGYRVSPAEVEAALCARAGRGRRSRGRARSARGRAGDLRLHRAGAGRATGRGRAQNPLRPASRQLQDPEKICVRRSPAAHPQRQGRPPPASGFHMTDLYAVIGNPISHSKSPLIHKGFAQATGQDLDYIAIEAPLGRFAETVDAWRGRGLRGLNITVPFKLDAFAYATRRDMAADEAGAVNCLSFDGEEAEGANYDGVGLVRDIEANLSTPIAGKAVLILGTGGATRGALGPILSRAPSRLTVAFRTPGKEKELHALFPEAETLDFLAYADLGRDAYDLILNATSATLSGEAPPVPQKIFARHSLAYDLAYGKGLTPFLRLAREAGVEKCVDGVGMLVEQAAEAFARWRGVRPETRAMIEAITVPLE